MEKREGSIHFGLKTIIPWGKRFKGKTVAEVLELEDGIEYIKWMHEHTDNMVVEPEVLVKLYDTRLVIKDYGISLSKVLEIKAKILYLGGFVPGTISLLDHIIKEFQEGRNATFRKIQ